jgi:hypothetical protein
MWTQVPVDRYQPEYPLMFGSTFGPLSRGSGL